VDRPEGQGRLSARWFWTVGELCSGEGGCGERAAARGGQRMRRSPTRRSTGPAGGRGRGAALGLTGAARSVVTGGQTDEE
jgi:hypothetical protein